MKWFLSKATNFVLYDRGSAEFLNYCRQNSFACICIWISTFFHSAYQFAFVLFLPVSYNICPGAWLSEIKCLTYGYFYINMMRASWKLSFDWFRNLPRYPIAFNFFLLILCFVWEDDLFPVAGSKDWEFIFMYGHLECFVNDSVIH